MSAHQSYHEHNQKSILGISSLFRHNRRKYYSLLVADLYERGVFSVYGGKIRACAEELLVYDYGGGEVELAHTMFCGCRLCPVCAHRRSLKAYNQLSRVMDYLDDQRRFVGKNPYQYLLVTLTMQNVAGDALPEAIDRLYDGFVRLNHLSIWKRAVRGAWRTLEVTYNKDAHTFHPHLHVFCVVNKSYFQSKDYIPQSELIALWQQCAKLPYPPSVRITKVREPETVEARKDLFEVTKYVVKQSQLDALEYLPTLEERVKVVEYLHAALHGRKLFTAYGVIRKAQRAMRFSDEDGDLLDINDDGFKLADEIRRDLAYTLRAFVWTDDNGYVPLVGSHIDVARSLNALESAKFSMLTMHDFYLHKDGDKA